MPLTLLVQTALTMPMVHPFVFGDMLRATFNIPGATYVIPWFRCTTATKADLWRACMIAYASRPRIEVTLVSHSFRLAGPPLLSLPLRSCPRFFLSNRMLNGVALMQRTGSHDDLFR